MDFTIQTNGIDITGVTEFSELSGFDIKQENTQGNQSVSPKQSNAYELNGQQLLVKLTPLSWNMIRCTIKN